MKPSSLPRTIERESHHAGHRPEDTFDAHAVAPDGLAHAAAHRASHWPVLGVIAVACGLAAGLLGGVFPRAGSNEHAREVVPTAAAAVEPRAVTAADRGVPGASPRVWEVPTVTIAGEDVYEVPTVTIAGDDVYEIPTVTIVATDHQ